MDRTAPPPSFSNLKLSLSAVIFLSALLALTLLFQRIASAPQPGQQSAPGLDMSSTSPPDLADQDNGQTLCLWDGYRTADDRTID
jgi:hypothetical protein